MLYVIIYLKPVLPKIAAGIEEFLMIPELSWDDLSRSLTNHTINKYQHLASRIALEDVENILE